MTKQSTMMATKKKKHVPSDASLHFPEVLCENVPENAEKYSLVECRDKTVVKYCTEFRDIEVCLYGVNIENLVTLPPGSNKSWKLQGYAQPIGGGIPIHFNIISATGEGIPPLLTGAEMLFELGEALVAFNSSNVLNSIRTEVNQAQQIRKTNTSPNNNSMLSKPITITTTQSAMEKASKKAFLNHNSLGQITFTPDETRQIELISEGVFDPILDFVPETRTTITRIQELFQEAIQNAEKGSLPIALFNWGFIAEDLNLLNTLMERAGHRERLPERQRLIFETGLSRLETTWIQQLANTIRRTRRT